jgi:hypothetical protein
LGSKTIVWYYLSQFVHCLVDFSGILTGSNQIGLMTGNTRVSRRTTAGNNRERESV